MELAVCLKKLIFSIRSIKIATDFVLKTKNIFTSRNFILKKQIAKFLYIVTYDIFRFMWKTDESDRRHKYTT
jgi:hypothetical protein